MESVEAAAIGNELWPLVLEHVPDRSPALLGMGFACRNTRAASVRSKGPTGWGRGTSLSVNEGFRTPAPWRTVVRGLGPALG